MLINITIKLYKISEFILIISEYKNSFIRKFIKSHYY